MPCQGTALQPSGPDDGFRSCARGPVCRDRPNYILSGQDLVSRKFLNLT